MNEKRFYEDFEKYYDDIPDCVSNGVQSYKDVIESIFALTNGILNLNKFEANDDNRKYKLNLTINNKEYIFEFNGSDYFEENLLSEFNKIIAIENPSEKRRLIQFGDGMYFDFAIAFFEKDLEYQLAKEGKIWKREDWIFNYENNK